MVISLNIFFQVRDVDTPATCHSSMCVCVCVRMGSFMYPVHSSSDMDTLLFLCTLNQSCLLVTLEAGHAEDWD